MSAKLIPQSLEAEQSVLGACLIDSEALSVAQGILKPSDFYREHHKAIFAAMTELFTSGGDAMIFDVAEKLGKEKLAEVGGAEYLSALVEACDSSLRVVSYAKVVLEKAERRNLIAAAAEMTARAYEDENIAEVKAFAERSILTSSRDQSAGDCRSASEVAVRVLTQLEQQIQNKGRIIGQSTGFPDIDKMMGGFRKNHLVLLAARPSMGKSAMLLQMAKNVAESGKPVLIFGFEMSNEETIQRLACNMAEVDSWKFEHGMVSDEEIGRVLEVVKSWKNLPLFVQDTSRMSPNDMKARARRIEAEHGKLGLIGVDYIQIVADNVGHRGGTRAETLGNIARQLHEMGGERDCTVLALSQLSRNVEQRENPRPMLSDLRDSGSLEAEANRVAFLYRPGYYQRQRNPNDPNIDDSVCEFIIGKNRGGRCGTVRLRWTGKHTRFDNMVQFDDENEPPVYDGPPAPVWNSGRDYNSQGVTI